MNTRRNLERVNLLDSIPLSSPLFGYIEPTNYCNSRCLFCPTGTQVLPRQVGRKSGFMDYTFAMQVIDQFAEFPRKLKSFHFQHMGEPLLNKSLPYMIDYAVKKDVSEWYELRTNGLLLEPKINQRLINSGLTRIGVSVNGLNAEMYKANCGIKVNFNQFVDNLSDLFMRRGECEIYIKIIDTHLTDEDKVNFFKIFKPISTDLQIEYLVDWGRSDGHDFKLGEPEGNTMKGYAPILKEVCPYPFFTLGVTWNGEAIFCCFDWSYATSCGNVKDTTLNEIWGGERLRQFRIQQLSLKREENPACKGCMSFHMCVDNLDNDREMLIERLEADHE